MFKYRVEFLVCRDDNTWFIHVQYMSFIYSMGTADTGTLSPFLMAAFYLPGDFAHVSVYSITAMGQEEEKENPLDVVKDALQRAHERIDYQLTKIMGYSSEALALWESDDEVTVKAIEVIDKMIEEQNA